MPKADLVLEGGGMKGLGLVGAVRELLRQGWEFPRVCGTSAGSIVGALLAAGVTEETFEDVMGRLDYARVPDRGLRIPLLGEAVSLLTSSGAFEGDYVHRFVRDELERLGVRTFGDLRHDDPGADPNLPPERRYKLVVTATDVTNGRLLRLPWDFPLLGLDPDEQLVADAVRASISIPLYFDPVHVDDARTGGRVTLVDGGVLSNFPVETFDRTDGERPRWPTFGVSVIPQLPAGDPALFPLAALPVLPPVRLLEQVVATAIVGNDQTYTEQPCVRRRTIEVETGQVGVVEFGAPQKRRDAVVENGRRAAEAFLARWDFDAYRRRCRPEPDLT